MRRSLFAIVFLAIGSAASAQNITRFLEIRPLAGAFLPTGQLRDVLDDAAIYGIQAAMEYRPTLHFVGSFQWIPGHNSMVAVDDAVNIFQYDLGAEFNLLRPMGRGWDFKPFLGAGFGGRTYNYDAMSLATNTCTAGYGVVGTEFQYRVTAIRLEARNYVSCFKDPVVGGSKTRNDVGLSVGLAYHIGHHSR